MVQPFRSIRYLILSIPIALVMMWGVFFAVSKPTTAREPRSSSPKLANYYLGELHGDEAFLRDLARYDVLILTPAQMASYPERVRRLRQLHPDIIILAYVPSQSYNTKYWHYDPIFRYLRQENSWWLRDSQGGVVKITPDLLGIDMNHEWSEYLVGFVQDRIVQLPGVDGIFFDIVSSNISWANQGDIDMNLDRVKDTPAVADALWTERTKYFLSYAAAHLNTPYIIINGTSFVDFQPYVNGRMFETFPTPWDGDGSWATAMNNLRRGKEANRQPQLMILNGNTGNTGEKNNFKAVRFGITSSLLEDDTYYSFDFGDTNHSQLWWYDEYDVDLGQAIGRAKVVQSTRPSSTDQYTPGLWRRDFTQGISLVNSGDLPQTVVFDSEYEKIHGMQDATVNDGSIISETTVLPHDGVLLLKTLSTVSDVPLVNNDFTRFFRPDGSRVRNGFFLFDETQRSGDIQIHTDLNGDEQSDLVVVSGSRVSAWRDDGQSFMTVHPYTASYRGSLAVTAGDVNGDGQKDIIVAPGPGSTQPVKIYTHDNEVLVSDWYPFGRAYRGGIIPAIGDVKGSGNLIVLATASGQSRVALYTPARTLVGGWQLFGTEPVTGVAMAVGNVRGDAKAEIIVGIETGKKTNIRIFDGKGALVAKEFVPYASGRPLGLRLGATDVDFDGLDDIVVLTRDVGL